MRVLGVDPGLTRCGFAVLDVGRDRRVRLVEGGVVRSSSTEALGDRLLALEDAFTNLIRAHVPNTVGIERVFSQRNVSTNAGTAQAAGVAALVAARFALPVEFHTPTAVKAAVTGSGAAAKEQVAAMVQRIVGSAVFGPADVTDAIAIAICHGWAAQASSYVANRRILTGGPRP